MSAKNPVSIALKHPSSSIVTVLCTCLIALSANAFAYSPKPDLTAAGAIATLKTDTNASPVYGETYNLGATGLRGRIYIDRNNVGDYGLQTNQSRQILVNVVGSGTPAAGVLAVDDVILGAKGGTGAVPAFTGDCRKAFGYAIGDAETAANGGVLSLLRWRAGATSTVTITLPVMGSYSSTIPYSCPKSALVLANARNNLVGQLLANQSSLTKNLAGAVNGLALLAGVAPGDPNYSTVQSRLQTYAWSLVPSASLSGCDTWNWAYFSIFLGEYYLRTVADGAPDTQVLPGINAYTVALAKGQSKYGTFGHKGAEQLADGSLHGSISWYGPVNAAGIPANVGIVIGKKALLAAGQAIDPEIDPAIERANNFFGWYMNKGSIPYGEHEPAADNHGSNGKDSMCAVLFGLQTSRPAETEYYARMSTAGCTGREYGHTGQGLSYLWGALGTNVGGPAAVTAYLDNIRWHLDLERRTDGSFIYDGGEQYGAGHTADGTCLGQSELYGGMNPTAWYILSYSLPHSGFTSPVLTPTRRIPSMPPR